MSYELWVPEMEGSLVFLPHLAYLCHFRLREEFPLCPAWLVHYTKYYYSMVWGPVLLALPDEIDKERRVRGYQCDSSQQA